MVKYSLIMEYLKKGNNYSQIATLCGCSRTTVWEVVKRIDYFKIQLADIDGIDEVELRSILFPERVRKDEKYLVIDFKWEEFQMRKHQSSLRLCWRRYCKRAAKQGLKAYSWASFGLLYSQYKKPCADDDDPHDAVRNKLKHYNLLLSYCNPGGTSYEKIKQEKEDWLSMIDIGIKHGDLVVIRKQNTAENGDIIVAMMNGETTLKRFYKRNGKVVLHPENKEMKDIIVKDCEIQGVLVSCIHIYN